MFLYNKLHRSQQRFDGIEIHNDGCSEGEGLVNVQLGIVKDMKWYKRLGISHPQWLGNVQLTMNKEKDCLRVLFQVG